MYTRISSRVYTLFDIGSCIRFSGSWTGAIHHHVYTLRCSRAYTLLLKPVRAAWTLYTLFLFLVSGPGPCIHPRSFFGFLVQAFVYTFYQKRFRCVQDAVYIPSPFCSAAAPGSCIHQDLKSKKRSLLYFPEGMKNQDK